MATLSLINEFEYKEEKIITHCLGINDVYDLAEVRIKTEEVLNQYNDDELFMSRILRFENVP